MHSQENTSIRGGQKSKSCLNCEATLLAHSTHCHNCGQSIKAARMTVFALFSELFTNLFNLDGKIWKTLRSMWIPAFLTKEYISGKRKTYFNPARFFAINLILHFLLLTYTMSYSDLNLDMLEDAAEITKSELVTKYDTIATSLIPSSNSSEIDTLRKALFGDALHVDQDTMFSSIILYNDMSEYGILKKDAYSLTPNELNEKYKISGWYNRLFVRQAIRINKNRESTLTYIIGNLTWVVILVLFFIAALMKLLYIRGGYFYVEHAVLMMLLHAKAFFVLNLSMLATVLIPNTNEDFMGGFTAIIYIITSIYFFVTMKIYYQQGLFKTFIKFIIVGICYLIALFFFMLIVSLIGVAIF